MRPIPAHQHLGPWYALSLGLLWPPMMAMTRRRWFGVANLGRPGDGLVVAANHMSWFDPLVIAHIMNDNDRMPRFLAKDSVFEIPVLGKIIDGAGQIPVYRHTADASGAVSAAVSAVGGGEAVVVYPEGTLTRDPDLWPMTGKTGAARIALSSGKPVVPLAHWGAQEIMGPYKKEFHVVPRKRLMVSVGPPVDLDDLREMPPGAEVLREASARIMDAITAQLAFLRRERPPQGRWDPRQGRRVVVDHPLPHD